MKITYEVLEIIRSTGSIFIIGYFLGYGELLQTNGRVYTSKEKADMICNDMNEN